MIDYSILCFGITRMEIHTLRCRFPYGFEVKALPADYATDTKLWYDAVGSAWCLFVNPEKLSPRGLAELLAAHEYATQHTHAAILLFTEEFTEAQQLCIDTRVLHRVDLKADFDKLLWRAIGMVRKAQQLCWDGMSQMRSNTFNDGWYLLELESTGPDPLEDELLSISISYMADYKIQFTETLYLKQATPISEKLETTLGITNEMLEYGITTEQAVDYLNNLPYKAPLIVKFYDYFIPFLKVLYRSYGQKFNLPYIQMDVLAAIVFGHRLYRNPYDILPSIRSGKYVRTPIDQPYLEKLYGLTLAVFEHLQERYEIGRAGDLHMLYYGSIDCGE